MKNHVVIAAQLIVAFATVGCGEGNTKSDADTGVDAGSSDTGGTDEDATSTARQSLVVTGDGVTLNGFITMDTDEVAAGDVSIGLRWNIEDGPFPPTPTTTSVELQSAGTLFSATTDIVPPAEALAPSESNGREGLAIAYVIAFVDGDDNDSLDCRNPGDCADIFVGASPNTLVLYGDPDDLTDFSPLFTFDGAPGIVPKTGWSLVHLVPNECEERPTARDWDEETDDVEAVVIGDFRERERCERRAVNPDID